MGGGLRASVRSAVLWSALLGLLASACTTQEPGPPTAGSTETGSVDASGVIDAAREGGASEEQIAVLESGEIAFADYERAVANTLACLREAGIDVVGGDVTEQRGFPEIQYSFAGSSPGRSDEQTLALADECMNRHSLFIEAEYQTSPVALEALEERFTPYRALMVDCIRENGGEVDDDAAREAVLLAAFATQEASGVDCLVESGYQP